MVVNRSEYKRRRKDEPDVLPESPKRTKVHAQRKFAQGSSTVTSPTLTPVKDKVKVNGSAPPAELLPAKRPHTEDFLTFLCFRGTRILPPRLNFFNTASVPESLDDDISAAGSSKNAKQNKNSDQAPNNSDVDRGRNKTKPASAQDRAAKALRKKYQEQRLAKQKKTCMTKLTETVKEDRLSKTRSSARTAELDQKRKRNARIMAYNKARKAVVASIPAAASAVAKPIVKRTLKQKQMRVGLRSGGQLPPGSDVGLKNPVRKTRTATPSQPSKNDSSHNEKNDKHSSSPQRRSIKGNNSKQFVSSLSDFSSEDEQPLVKKKSTSQSRQQPKARSPSIKGRLARSRQHQCATASTSGVTNRPSRKTKEAAALYMEMLGKDLRSPDEDFDDDEISVESFPELPNKKKTELREKELKALAEKGHSSREETKLKKTMKPIVPTSRAQKVIAKRVLSSKIDERNRRLQLRNKAKGKYLKERKKKEALRKRRVMLLARAAKQRAGKVYKERSSSEVESSSPSKSVSPIRGVDSRRSSLALKQAAEALKHVAEKLSESSLPKKQNSSPEKSASPEKSVPKKKLQSSPERSSITKRAIEKKSTKIVDKNQPANAKKAPGKNTLKNSINEPNNTSDKNVKDNQLSTNSQKNQQPVEKNVDKKLVGHPNRTASNQNKNPRKEEVKQSSSRTISLSKKPSNISKNSTSCSVSKDKKSCLSKGDESSDNFSDSDEEPLTKLTKKTRNDREIVSTPKTAPVPVTIKTEANSDKNDSQCKPPKQRKQKSPQKKFVDSGIDKTPVLISPKMLSGELNTKKTKSQTLGSNQSEMEKNNAIGTKNVPVENKEGNENETNVKLTSDDKLSKSGDEEVIQNKTAPNEATKGDKKGSTKDLSSDQVKLESKVTEGTVDTLPIKTEGTTVSSTSSNSTEKSLNQRETPPIELAGNINESSAPSSLNKPDKIDSFKGSSNVGKKTIENKVQKQMKVENCLTADGTSSTMHFVDSLQGTKNVKIEKSSSFDEFFTDKKQLKKETAQNLKKIKLEKSSSFDEAEMNKKSVMNLSHSAKQLKTEKSPVLDESTVEKKVFKDSLRSIKPLKVEKSLASDESLTKRKNDPTKSMQFEESSTSDESLLSKALEVGKLSTSEESLVGKKSLQSQTTRNTSQTKVGTNLGGCVTPNDSTGNKKNVENVSFLPRKISTTSVTEQEGSNSLSVAPSEKTLQKQENPLFTSEDSRVTKSIDIFEATKSNPSIDLDSSLAGFKNPSIAVPKTKPVSKDVATVGKLNSEASVNPEVKPVTKGDVKTILSVPKINLDKSSGGSFNKAKTKVVSSVDVQVSSVSGQASVLLDENKSSESSKLGYDKLVKELNVPRSLESSASKTPVKSSHVLPACSPVNPLNTIKPIARLNYSSNEVKKTKSVNDTWRQAFKNAKIPKPGQSSPVMSDEKPFVRKPFTSHAMKKQIQFDNKGESPTNSRGDVGNTTNNSLNLVTPFAVNRKPFAVTSTPTQMLSNVITTSNIIPVVTVTMSTKNSVVSIPIPAASSEDATRAQRTIDPDELRLKEAEIVEDIVRMYGVDYEGSHKNLLIGSASKSEIKPFTQQMLPQTTFNSSTTTESGKQIITFTTKVENPDPTPPQSPVVKNTVEKVLPDRILPESSSTDNDISPAKQIDNGIPPAKQIDNGISPAVISTAKPVSPSILEGEKPKGPGKHHNLPMPVEQTLKKLQTKSLVTKKPPPLQKTFQDQLLRKQQQSNCDKNVSPTSSRMVDSSASAFVSDLPSNSGLLNKKKVNMSTEEIKKWLNDSTSTGIEHTRDCGIFEKNQCECGPSFSDKTSPITPEPSSPLTTEDQSKTLNKTVHDKTVASVGIEAGSVKKNNVKDSLGVNVDSIAPVDINVGNITLLQSEKVVCEPAVVEKKSTGNAFKQQQLSPQTAFTKSLDSPQKFPAPESKSAFVGSSFISTNKLRAADKTPTKDENEDKLKVSVESKQDGDGRKIKSDAHSPSAQFSPPLTHPLVHQREETSSNDDSPEKSSSSSVQQERRSIFHQKRSVFRSRPALSRSPSAFSPENESSVYAFEPDLPMTSAPFRRTKGNKEGRTSNATTDDEDAGLSSNSIAVQVNIDNEEVLECSTQTDDDDGDGGHLFYIPIQRNSQSENVVGSGSGQQVIQGVAVKLGTEGPDQRVIMSAKLVTKPRSTFASSTSTPRPLASRGESIGVSCKPEQKVKPLTMSASHAVKPPVGTVQPTARVIAPPETLARHQKSEAVSTLRSNAATDAKLTKSANKTVAQTSVDSVKKIDKEIPAADFDRRKPEETSSESAAAKSSTAAVDQEKGSQCDASSLSLSPSPTPPPTDRRRKAAVTSSFASSAERGRKTSAAIRKQSPTPFLGKKTRKSSPSLKDTAAGSDSHLAGPSSKAKRSKGRGVGTASDSSGIDARANLEEAPVFYPTEREFLDPLEYIEKIRPVAEKYGICKVIPPADFKPECKVSDDMRFTAYNQYVHKMQQRWGPNVKEMLAIRRHLATQSISMTQPPWIGGMEVDLPRLYQTVQNCGGLREVMEKKRWTRVADAMRIPKFAQDRVTKLDDIYCKFLLPYDTLSHDERSKLFQSVELEWERRLLKNDYDYDDDDEDDDSDSDDSCNLEECIVKGKTMALSAFYRVARNTMAVHFPKNDSPSAVEVETEFWNNVASRQSHVCVLSGSIDSGAFGYGFPIVKNSATSKHPWNLKVLTNNSGTILRSLGPQMGVTVPTLHVGMVFTACCWYRDPHGLPWIEYLHTGKSKIWYGIPDASSSAFRAAMMDSVPRLCRDKSIWLASDTAMVPPHLLAARGVQLCRTVQEPGQFIVVFPKAFTSSICTGYLVSESVYFAQPSWLATAHSVFKDISDSSEPSMFSLERLLFSIASDARSHLDVLSQVLPMVEEIKESELNQRFELEKLGLTQTERILLSKARGKSRLAHDEDGDYECETCRANLFLSFVKNTQDDCVYCLKHAIEHLKEKPGDLKHYNLLYTYNGEEFDELIEKIKTRMEQKSQKKQQSKSSAAGSSSSKADQH